MSRRGWRTPVLGAAVFRVWQADALRKLDWMSEFLPSSGPLLEVGSGPGSLLRALRSAGYSTVGLDVRDDAFEEALRPILYDGGPFPFEDDHFAASVVATTLHHAHRPVHVLKEAARVAPRVLVIEDIYRTAAQRKLTKIVDSLVNLEFRGHPHHNQSDQGWRSTFAELGLELVHTSQRPFAGAFLQALYVLERSP
ncbi:MAG: methyltransferase domain-containing protein [Myxococcota bacterium]